MDYAFGVPYSSSCRMRRETLGATSHRAPAVHMASHTQTGTERANAEAALEALDDTGASAQFGQAEVDLWAAKVDSVSPWSIR